MYRQGLAKMQFIEMQANCPSSISFSLSKNAHWPYFNYLLKQQVISYLDYILVDNLLRECQQAKECVALFLCHLVLATRKGHLCVKIDQSNLSPLVDQLWLNEERKSLEELEIHQLKDKIIEGSQQIPQEIRNNALNSSLEELLPYPIYQNDQDFYLQKHWNFETLLIDSLLSFLSYIPTLHLCSKEFNQKLEQLVTQNILLKEQAQAIACASSSALTFITGGPGTGKTYTAGHLINLFWQQLSSEQQASYEIVLAAPTGKAASNLQKSLSRVTDSLANFPLLQAKTLHSLLEVYSHSVDNTFYLAADLVVVDESSMIDVKMMAALFRSLKPGGRLILLGDEHQLPSVDAGNVFADLLQVCQRSPHSNMASVFLKKCVRTDLQNLVSFAQLVQTGDAEGVLNFLQENPKEIKKVSLVRNVKDDQKKFIEQIISFFPSTVDPLFTPQQLIQQFQKIRLLSPFRRGAFGVETLNQLIWQFLCQKLPTQGFVAIPIMITTNDYRQELFNGETGVLIRKLPIQPLGLDDHAFFPSKQQEECQRFSALLLPKYDYAYCLSIHKSQGSEFDHVLVVLPEGSELFGREVLYTAITRARKKIAIYCSDQVLSATILQRNRRLSGVCSRLESCLTL